MYKREKEIRQLFRILNPRIFSPLSHFFTTFDTNTPSHSNTEIRWKITAA